MHENNVDTSTNTAVELDLVNRERNTGPPTGWIDVT
jgi:hypothetical protein